MNRAEIRALVIDHTGRSDKTALIDSMINTALKKVSAEHIWRDLLTEASVTMIPAQSFVDLVATLRRLSEVRIIDGLNSYKLIVRTKSFLIERWPDFDSQADGKPRFGYLEGVRLHLVPPPDEALTLRYSYYRRIADLTDDTTDIVIDIADEAVVAYATYRVFKSLQQHEDAALWFADYEELMKDAKMMDRSTAVELHGVPRDFWGTPIPTDYWVDPFLRRTPGGARIGYTGYY